MLGSDSHEAGLISEGDFNDLCSISLGLRNTAAILGVVDGDIVVIRHVNDGEFISTWRVSQIHHVPDDTVALQFKLSLHGFSVPDENTRFATVLSCGNFSQVGVEGHRGDVVVVVVEVLLGVRRRVVNDTASSCEVGNLAILDVLEVVLGIRASVPVNPLELDIDGGSLVLVEWGL